MKKKINKSYRKLTALLLAAVLTAVTAPCITADAEGRFDPVFYSQTYPDVAEAFGTDAELLYGHYTAFGQKEGRMPYYGASGGESVNGYEVPSETPVPDAPQGIVPIDSLQNYKSLKGKMTDAEFQTAYNEALKIVQPLSGMEKNDQAYAIMTALRGMVDNGQVGYSTSLPHYNNAYGYLVNHVASCAGSTRTTGLCLNMLGIDYEHVHENQWCHQWCRVEINGTTWVVDPYAYTCIVEKYPYWHPLANCGM